MDRAHDTEVTEAPTPAPRLALVAPRSSNVLALQRSNRFGALVQQARPRPRGHQGRHQAWILRNVNHCVEVTQFTCNGTGAGDGHANHWVRLVSPVNFTGGKATFTVFTWARR